MGNRSNYAKAQPLLLRALKITEKALGRDHPGTDQVRENLLRLYFGKVGDIL